MSINLDGKVTLVTGASSGMGFEMSRALSEHGATVVMASRAGAKLDGALEALASRGLDVHTLPMDVTDDTSVRQAAERFWGDFGRLDLLVSNAGVGDNAPGMECLAPDHKFYDVPMAAVRAMVETNLLGFLRVADAFAPGMEESGGGIVYVSTSDATMSRPGQLPYGPSKAGGEAMARIMAQELSESDVTVNILCPGGFTDTPMAGPGVKEYFRENGLPILSPDVMNRAVLFLASPEARGVSGQKIVATDLDGWLAERGIAFSG